jgi:type II secretory pathway component PulJ
MTNRYKTSLTRRGAALMIALVLLAVVGAVAGTVCSQIVRNRQEVRLDLLRAQTRQLLNDALRNAEAKRKIDSAFSGETQTLASDCQPFPGTFQITTRFENEIFAAEVEYRNKEGAMVHAINNK